MAKFTTLDDYLASITKPENANQLSSTLDWISAQYPQLELRLAWNQPMFTDHDTFIIGFSAAAKDFAVAVEAPVFAKYLTQINALGYRATKRQFHVAWGTKIDEALLHELIDDAITLKKDVTTFWLPKQN